MAEFNLQKAVAWNPHYSRTTNPPWKNRFHQVITELGFDNMTPGPELFAEAVYDWQVSRGIGKADGILGPKSWSSLEPQTRYSIDLTGPSPGWLGKPKPNSKSAKKKSEAAYEAKKVYTRQEIYNMLLSEADLPEKYLSEVSLALSGLNVARTTATILQVGGVIGSFTTTAFLFAASAPITMTIGNVIALINALEGHYRTVGRLAYAYGFTCWAYNLGMRPLPPSLESRFRSMPYHSSRYLQEGKLAWNRFFVKAFWDAPRLAREIEVHGEPLTPAVLRDLLLIDSKGDPEALFQTMLESIRKKISSSYYEALKLRQAWKGLKFDFR